MKLKVPSLNYCQHHQLKEVENSKCCSHCYDVGESMIDADASVKLHLHIVEVSIQHEAKLEVIQSSTSFVVKDSAGMAFVVAGDFVGAVVEVITVGRRREDLSKSVESGVPLVGAIMARLILAPPEVLTDVAIAQL